MKERPILFSAPMVRAILDGRKTQTRRIVSPQPTLDERGLLWWNWSKNAGSASIDRPGQPSEEWLARCPHGQSGDRLWVRESFWGCDTPGYGDQPCVVYDDEWHGKEYRPTEIRPWARKFGRIPSIHMPRDCSRILLEITGVRVERLNDCSEADAITEGIERDGDGWLSYAGGSCVGFPTTSYASLWDSINGAGAWETNPWVWVVEFRRVR